MMTNYEKVCDAASNLSSPVEDPDGNLYLVTQNGDVIKSKDGHTIVSFKIKFFQLVRQISISQASSVVSQSM